MHAHPLCQHGGGEQGGRCGSGGDALREGHKWGKQMVTSVEGTDQAGKMRRGTDRYVTDMDMNVLQHIRLELCKSK